MIVQNVHPPAGMGCRGELGRRRGFTLVELLVALALSAVISVSIMFISTQARNAYDATVKKVDVYNKFRLMFQTVENDLKQWVSTGELEFYTDGRGQGARLNQHYDIGEEVPDLRDQNGAGVVDGGVYGKFDEFGYILQRRYLSRETGQPKEKLHDAYQCYFRTVTYVDGGIRVANVEYLLADPTQPLVNGKPQIPNQVERENIPNLSIFKIVRYQDISIDVIMRQTEIPVKRKVIEVATNVTDFRLEYTAENRFSRSNVAPGFRTPGEEYDKSPELAVRPTVIRDQGPDGVYVKRFGYGSVDLETTYVRATAFPSRGGDQGLANQGEHTPVRFGLQGDPTLSFAQLTPGDRIFVFTGSSRGEASAAGGTGNSAQLIRFPSGDYTVKTNLRGLLEFSEDIDSASWNGEPQPNIFYKAPFLPSAVRVTIRVVDDRGENPKTMQRVIWLRRRSRS